MKYVDNAVSRPVAKRVVDDLRLTPGLDQSLAAQARKLLQLEYDEKSGGYIIKGFTQEE